ncbi:ABC transporter permease [Candidatus Nanohalococcus occultus]|uniref:ABC transporter permease n=1 Tax=Candidatus Nanohalococcus occultus TaxID=2978047 RepID=UPI0039DF65D0
MSELKRHLKAYSVFFKGFIKSKLIYKTDFALGMVHQLVSIGLSLGFIGLIFTQVDSIQGWTLSEMLFLTGFARLVYNTHSFFLFGVYSLGEFHIVNGSLDRYKVRPLNVLFQVYSNYVQIHAIADIVVSLGIIAYTLPKLSVNVFTPSGILYGLMALLSSILAYAGIFLFIGSTGFWTGRTESLFGIFFEVNQFRKYPIEIFSASLQFLFTAILPIAAASFYPVEYLLGRGTYLTGYSVLLAGPVFFLASYSFFKYGLKNYSSTGS